MSNHKAHFRGDIQVDGSIVGPDGQPVGGSVDVSGLLAVDGSRAMTGPLDFGALDDTPWGALWFDGDNEGFSLMTDPDFSSETDLYVDSPHVDGNDRGSVAIFAGEEDIAGWAGVSVHAGNAFAQLAADSTSSPGAILSYIWGGVVPTHGRILRSVDNYFSEPYFAMGSDGKIEWGDGTAAPDVTLKRSGVGWMDLDGKGLQIFDPTASMWMVEDEDWNNYAGYGINGLDVEFPTGAVTLNVNSEQVQFSLFDAFGGWYTNTRQAHFYAGADDPTHIFWAWGVTADGGNMRWKFDYNGRLQWGPGSTGPDTHLKRRAAGVLELEENGGGLVLHSPDGTAYKISVANGGALSAVAA